MVKSPKKSVTKKQCEDENKVLEEKEIPQVEIQNMRMENNTVSHNSEKPFKSLIDTRLVNNGNDNQKYYLVEENENKTENEYVFSENINIDNLSYNDPITTKKNFADEENIK